jgi:hypothetical protein
MDRSQISFVKFILEAYDNVAVMSTLDPRQALVQVIIAPGCETLVDGIMNGLGGEVGMVPVEDAETGGVSEVQDRWPAGGNG